MVDTVVISRCGYEPIDSLANASLRSNNQTPVIGRNGDASSTIW